MIAVARRTVLSIVLFLTSVGTASAECVWVLWVRETLAGQAGVSERPWESARAAPTSDACEAAQTEIITNIVSSWAKAKPDRDPPRVVGSTVFTDLQGVIFSQQFRCLPDTIDPRGPKGGTR
jgi:hypothetical protein